MHHGAVVVMFRQIKINKIMALCREIRISGWILLCKTTTLL